MLFMSVIRVSEETYEELKKLMKLTGAKSMSELISFLVKVSQKEIDRFNGNPRTFLSTLKYTRSAGKYDSEKVDELLYGEEH
jgi:predicted CopG family antitoxin